jgi:hypothetical protein
MTDSEDASGAQSFTLLETGRHVFRQQFDDAR